MSSSATRLLARLEYQDKEISELSSIVVSLSRKAASLPASQASFAALQEITDRINVINDILAERSKKEKKIKEAEQSWKEHRSSDLEKAWKKLPYSSSANGQLIVAILEDEPGLTISQVAYWCDELSAMELSAVGEILNGMVAEGSLLYDCGRYYVRQICTENLIVENPAKTVMEIIKKDAPYWSKGNENVIYNLLKELEKEGAALAPQTIEKRIGKFIPSDNCAILKTDTALWTLCEYMSHADLLSESEFGDNIYLYYFNTLGFKQYEAPDYELACLHEKSLSNNSTPGGTRNQKSVATRVLSEKQLENQRLKDAIIERIGQNGKSMLYTIDEIKELFSSDEEVYKITISRMSALISQLVAEGRLERISGEPHGPEKFQIK